MNQSKSIVLCGCTESMFDVANHLLENNIKISQFVSLNKNQAKRYLVSDYKSFEKLSKKFKIPIYFPKSYSLKENEDAQFFEKNQFDLMVVGGWQRLIPQKILETLKIGSLGIHGSPELLPKGRGRSTVNWSIIEGKKKFILHVFFMTPGIDDGKIIERMTCDINGWDTCRTLYYKFTIMHKRMLENIIPRILKKKYRVFPQVGRATYYPKRTPDDGLINWNKTSKEIHNLIRGVTKPYPGAFTFLGKRKVMIWNSQPFDSKIKYSKAKNGEIVEKFANGDFIVKCKSNTIMITEYDGQVKNGQIFV